MRAAMAGPRGRTLPKCGEVLLAWAGARSEGVASRARKALEYLGLSVLDEASPECAKSGKPGPRTHPGDPEARVVCLAAQRQRRADARGRSARRARATGHLARHRLARVSGTEREAGGVVGLRR